MDDRLVPIYTARGSRFVAGGPCLVRKGDKVIQIASSGVWDLTSVEWQSEPDEAFLARFPLVKLKPKRGRVPDKFLLPEGASFTQDDLKMYLLYRLNKAYTRTSLGRHFLLMALAFALRKSKSLGRLEAPLSEDLVRNCDVAMNLITDEALSMVDVDLPNLQHRVGEMELVTGRPPVNNLVVVLSSLGWTVRGSNEWAATPMENVLTADFKQSACCRRDHMGLKCIQFVNGEAWVCISVMRGYARTLLVNRMVNRVVELMDATISRDVRGVIEETTETILGVFEERLGPRWDLGRAPVRTRSRSTVCESPSTVVSLGGSWSRFVERIPPCLKAMVSHCPSNTERLVLNTVFRHLSEGVEFWADSYFNSLPLPGTHDESEQYKQAKKELKAERRKLYSIGCHGWMKKNHLCKCTTPDGSPDPAKCYGSDGLVLPSPIVALTTSSV